MVEIESDNSRSNSRRNFFAKACTALGISALLAGLMSSVYANFRFFFPKVLYEPPSRFKAGLPDSYQSGVSDNLVKDHQVWIVREGDKLYTLLAVCTHLGCLTSFFPNEGLFKCPCHGSNFSLQGDPVAGPAPVPLYRLALSLGEDGQIVVDKARRENRPGKRDQQPYVLEV